MCRGGGGGMTAKLIDVMVELCPAFDTVTPDSGAPANGGKGDFLANRRVRAANGVE